jgi:hypothetical protein
MVRWRRRASSARYEVGATALTLRRLELASWSSGGIGLVAARASRARGSEKEVVNESHQPDRAGAGVQRRRNLTRLFRNVSETVIWVETIINGVLLGALYGLFGLGLAFAFGIMRIVNVAQGEFIVLSAFRVYFGRGQTILLERERIKRKTIQHRRLLHKTHAA